MKNYEIIQSILDYLIEQLNIHQDILVHFTEGKEFEDEILNRLTVMSTKKKPIEFKLYHNGPHSFPDISISFFHSNFEHKFGLEVKFSASGNWKSKGNSVFESITDSTGNEFEEIYIFYGRKPKLHEETKDIELMYRPYYESIDKIEVTHSPRFSINMLLEPDKNLFKLIDVEENYQRFRGKNTSEKNDFLRKYFSKITPEKKKDRWYLPTNNYETQTEELSIPPLLINELSKEVKQLIIAECIILFLFELIKPKTNYRHIASYLIERHFVYTMSLRDLFTSGGKEDIYKDGIMYPQIFYKIFNNNNFINIILNNHDNDFENHFRNSWSEYFINEKSQEFFLKTNDISIDVKELFRLYVTHLQLEKFIPIS